MIKALHAFDVYLPVTECWIYRMIHNLDQEEVEVHIGSKRFLRKDRDSTEFKQYRFPVGFFERPRRNVFERAINRAMHATHRLYPWYLNRKLGPVDLIHSHFGPPASAFHGLARKRKIPHLISMYGAEYTKTQVLDARQRAAYKVLFKEAACFLLEGPAAARTVAALGCPEEKIRVLRLGLELDGIPVFSRIKKPDSLHLIQMATWREKKGHVYTLEAFSDALKSCPNMTLTLVGGSGDGLRERLLAPYGDLIEARKIIVKDIVGNDELYNVLEGYDVFIHPSCVAGDGDAEGGAPIVLLDAQATGMPVVATRHCDIPDEVADGKSGLLVNERDSVGLSAAIQRFYAMGQAEYDTMSKHAVEHMRNEYDVKKSAAQLLDIYKDVLASSRRTFRTLSG